MNGIGPELPLSRNQSQGAYSLITSYHEEIKQNFKNLLLTAPGERVMDASFGVGLRHFLFEPRTHAIPKIRQRIDMQVRKYLPFIRIVNMRFDPGSGEFLEDSHVISIAIQYEVPSINLAATITLQGDDIN